jgi:hypothetical protein
MKSKASIISFTGFILAAVVLLARAAIVESGGNNVAIRPGETVDGLRMEARARLIDNKGEKQLVIHAVLINEGSNDVTVLTKALGPSLSRDARGLVAGFDYTAKQHLNGRLLIPSLHPNDPVTLRPSEATMLFAQVSLESFVDPLKDGEKIRVGYFVTDEWGERFDIWHGYVCAVIPVEGLPSK